MDMRLDKAREGKAAARVLARAVAAQPGPDGRDAPARDADVDALRPARDPRIREDQIEAHVVRTSFPSRATSRPAR